MRVLLIGHHHAWRMEAAVERAFRRAGHETFLIDDRRAKQLLGWRVAQRFVRYAARRVAPDFVFLSKCHALDLETVEHIIRGRANAMWYHDPQWFRDTDHPEIAHVIAVGKLAAVFFVTGFEAEWRRLGLVARFLPAAGDAGITPAPPDERCAADVAFIGTGYDPERARFLVELGRHAYVRVFGPGWQPWKAQLHWNGGPIAGHAFETVCSSARIVLGVNPTRAAGATTYTSDRTWMVILGGAFYLGAGTPGLDALLRDGVHCAWYTDLAHCVELTRYYLAHPELRARIRAAGERFVRAHHTYDARIPNLLSGDAFVNPLGDAAGELSSLTAWLPT